MSVCVYILYSKKIDKYYVGKSSEPYKRLQYHNQISSKMWSKRGQPWELKCVLEFKDDGEASKAERLIKRQKSRKVIESIIEGGWSI